MTRVARLGRWGHRGAAVRSAVAAALLALALSLSAAPALAQGCAMCYATARATPKDGQRALNRAILVMVLPPVGALVFGVGAVLRYSKKRDEENNGNLL